MTNKTENLQRKDSERENPLGLLYSNVGPYRVSTVKLICDHGFGGSPLWYETMVFKGYSWHDIYCDRYETEEEARQGHEKAIQWIYDGGPELVGED